MKHIILILSLLTVTAASAQDALRTKMEAAGPLTAAQWSAVQNEFVKAAEAAEAKRVADVAAVQAQLDAALARRATLIQAAKDAMAKLPVASQLVVSNVVYQASLPDAEARRAALIAQQAELQKQIDNLNK